MYILIGRRGRPKITVTRQQLEFLMTQGYTIKHMARLLGCSASFLYKRTKALGMPIRNSTSSLLTDEELEQHVRRLHNLYPRSGSEVQYYQPFHPFNNIFSVSILLKEITHLSWMNNSRPSI